MLGPQLFVAVDRRGRRHVLQVKIARETIDQRDARWKAYADIAALPLPHKHRHPPRNFIRTISQHPYTK